MNVSYLKKPSGILKLFEIALVVATFGILRDKNLAGFGDTTDQGLNNFYFGVGMLTAAMVVTPLLLAVYLSGKMDIQNSIFEPVVNALFGVSFVVYGSLMLEFYNDYFPNSELHDYALASGSLCLIAGICYCVDMYFAI
ncbi:hypothetical protein FHG87_015866, partial [Trinorchestia longiramus]